jgi:diguanylate cyclase (GGDEF)-like protein
MQEADELMKRNIGDVRTAAVLLMDLDHFKSVNDRFGHAVGDRVLQVFAETAKSSIRSTDLIGRLGGEEFAAVLCNAGRDKAMELAERIRSRFALVAVDVDGRPVAATASIGLAIADASGGDVRELLGQADQALYCAKERGRNRVELASLDLITRREEEVPLVPSARTAA